ncbi:hypothetical protein TELCIR_15926, partial [Teladorsagia circumcincta]
MELVSVLRVMAILSTFLPMNEAIDADVIQRAKDGEWVQLPSDDEETMIKIVKANQVFTDGKFRYEKAEEYCAEDDAHLASIHSNEEGQFTIDLTNAVISGHSYIYIGMKLAPAWADASSLEHVTEMSFHTESCYY